MANHATPPELQEAINRFNDWSDAHLLAEQQHNEITETLYHYTDARAAIASPLIWNCLTTKNLAYIDRL
jgi:hypothetical protein